MALAAGRAAFESLKAEAARLREDNERLEKQAKQREKENQQIKIQEAQAQARNVQTEEMGPVHAYLFKFPEPVGLVVLRSCIDAIQKTDPQAVISFADSSGCIVVGSGDAAQKQGISARQVIDFWTRKANGSGGGRESMAQGRIEKLNFFSMQEYKNFFQERLK